MLRNFTSALVATALLGTAATAQAAMPTDATLYKNPDCTCCDEYARLLEIRGIQVTIVDDANMAEIKQQARLPYGLGSCHTMKIGNYHVEGHVPYDAIAELFKQQPAIHGITLPGMPQGSPGMPGPQRSPFEIQQFTDQQAEPFMTL
ncbi:hypothetical protein HG264_04725 [Pseudomonas sp. gcc21]|uniref:DUF411 domain-containing protein n=1 Tax=Pseudomonas sp. gcc21 TaxID=2726989 RepID=UPI00145205AA|nr:DUF411 domain-containing protein [Pseudomonas sp. gcc21]QJD58259.1 hypothetical protein HG264_04725 [Pseudomonas sp. gcc21]